MRPQEPCHFTSEPASISRQTTDTADFEIDLIDCRLLLDETEMHRRLRPHLAAATVEARLEVV